MYTISRLSEGTGITYELIEIASIAIELLAVAIIIGAVFFSTARYFYSQILKKSAGGANYLEYKHSLGKSLLLGLEILVAADVVRTVALEPTILNVASLGLLVVVRTFLSWSLSVEIEGHWPWQPKTSLEEVQE
jgi:uncharacterized membrane protein